MITGICSPSAEQGAVNDPFKCVDPPVDGTYPSERLVIIEDTAEIQCAAKDYVQYHTSPDRSMTELVRMALRMRPDRILVGEVKGTRSAGSPHGLEHGP